MERELILRNVVCLVAEVEPSRFDLNGFGEQLNLGAGEAKILLANAEAMEWEQVRLQVLPDRLQVGFKDGADGEGIRRVTEHFLSRLDELAAGEPVSFNVAMRFTAGGGDPDPSEKIFNAASLAETLGGTAGRGGMSLVYHDDISRWWIELSPEPDRDNVWIFDFNRKFETFPQAGDDRDVVLDWFGSIEAGFLALFETICAGTD